MRRIALAAAALAVVALAVAASAAAQDNAYQQAPPPPAPQAAPQAAAPATPPPSVSGDIVASFDAAARKLVALAEALPAEKYPWRPAEGVRTASQVFMHVASGNYFIGGNLGVAAPEGVDLRTLEAVGDKDQVVATLKDSIAKVRRAMEATDPATLDQEVELFGRKFSKRRVMLLLAEHAHEHLGQAIAYARMNGVVPPWSQQEG